jgi:hypothetical protein
LKELSEQVGNCAMQLGVELGLSMVEIELSTIVISYLPCDRNMIWIWVNVTWYNYIVTDFDSIIIFWYIYI